MPSSISSDRTLRMLQVASWTLFTTSLSVYLLISMLYFVSGCPPEDNQSSSVLAQLALLPPGVTCTYDLQAGTLITGDEWWAPALIAGSLINALMLTKALSTNKRSATQR